ncbi:hypothetical protein LF887_15135 [Chryseobacterium sp. MEBOG06]|uniref:hypothetical protein n=1 Tax=unclassified Chryseobacterium TaxID=2593645 RepID=UPI001F206AA6|nr:MULTISPECIES: hypothetical protein [unclassified Chryseobacterium]UKB82338.1 hypothetical protein LF887_15135 [Chryseobacterium sp. MEBOG06]
MNKIVKITLALAAGSFLLYLDQRKKKKKTKIYLAPDGNTYKENQIYRTYNNRLYRNGKEFHYSLPELDDHHYSNTKYSNDHVHIQYKTIQKNTNYHHKGVRHQ